MFQLTDEEKAEVIANCEQLAKLKFSRTNPYTFLELGTIMLASVLNTPTAIQTSVLIVRAFVKLRENLSANKELERKLFDLESRYDKQFMLVFQAIRELMHQETMAKERPQVGYKTGQNVYNSMLSDQLPPLQLANQSGFENLTGLITVAKRIRK